MKKILKFLQNNIFPILIIIICGVLAWKNYDQGTYLLGWDSLHPEFNFKIAFERIVSGVWREDQGLGTVAIHSHMADLPRIVFIWLESFIIPLNLLRYGYIYLCMFLGPLGIYYFLNYIFEKEETSWTAKTSAFLGSIYYLLNLGTLQHFYVPFEMFTTQFALLPWLFLYILKYMRENRKSNLIIFAVLNLLAMPMAYAATLFYAYFMGIVVFLIGYTLFNKQKLVNLKKSFIVVIITLLINSFWLLPNFYTVITQGDVVSNSKINKLFSPEAFLRNRDYGDISDILIHKSFLFNWNAYNFDKKGYTELMKPWIDHLNNKKVVYIGYFISAIYILGLALSLIKRNKIGSSLFGVTLLSLFFLFNENFITSSLFKYLYDNFEIFSEGFRMPFTKFSLLFIFTTSFYFAYLLFELFKWSNKFLIGKVFNILFQTSIILGLIFYILPAFKGSFISNTVKTKLPNEYLQVFDWFGNNKNGRVAILPLNSLWGWENHDWKYEGSGFLSFGIENPLLVRDFDRWNILNENFYNEASLSFYSGDEESFKNILEKYQVRYLLFDESVMNTEGDKKIVEDFGFIKSFNSGFLTIYDTQLRLGSAGQANNFISVAKYPEIDTSLIKTIDGRTLSTENAIKETFESSHGFSEAYNCDLMKKGSVERSHPPGAINYKAFDGGVACDYFVFEDIKYDQTYALHIKGENKAGRSLKIYLYDWETKRVRLEELLPSGNFDEYYVIYSRKNPGSGYTVNIETRSFGRISSENIINTIEFIPFDLKPIALQGLTLQSELEIKSVKKFGTAIYKVETRGEGILELGQGYEKGWISYPKLEHLKVNSWANGFKINSDGIYYIFFWPQLLEWAGFIFLVLTIVYLIVKSNKNKKV